MTVNWALPPPSLEICAARRLISAPKLYLNTPPASCDVSVLQSSSLSMVSVTEHFGSGQQRVIR